jgi:hypothetical protein
MIAFLITVICAGVIPQHPPMIRCFRVCCHLRYIYNKDNSHKNTILFFKITRLCLEFYHIPLKDQEAIILLAIIKFVRYVYLTKMLTKCT